MCPDVQIGAPDPQFGSNVLGGTLPALPQWLTSKRAEATSRLPWPLSVPPQRTLLPMGEYVRRLKRSGICDTAIVPVPGATVMLPWGVALSERLAGQVRAAYARLDLDEYAYPQVVARQCVEPMADLLDLDQCLLHVSTALEGAKRRGILTPTGEHVIADHWRRMVRDPKVLPIRMFQRSRYFRPVSSADRSGKGVFAALESPDVFELHCCHLTRDQALNDLQRIAKALQGLIQDLPLPLFCGIRPPWGNRSQLYDWVLGYDTPLPCGESVQVSAMYFQGQKLSRRYDLGVGKGDQRHYLWQLDGFVSRRLLYAQLYLSINAQGAVCIHPQMAATQIVILALSQQESEWTGLKEARAQLQSLGQRPLLQRCPNGKVLHQALKQWRARGVPLIVLFFGQRESHELPRIRLMRTDTGAELDLPGSFSGLAQQIADALADVQTSADHRIYENARACLSFVIDQNEARQALSHRQCVISALCPTQQHVETIASWRMGEVCSFAAAEECQACIVCEKPTWARALLSRRL